jgi:SRSO17 transposase
VKADHQALHHFLTKAEWSVEEVRAIRLRLTREALAGRPCMLCLDPHFAPPISGFWEFATML